MKTRIGANVLLGRALVAGATVSLLITGPASDHRTRKTWLVTPYQAAVPEPADWRMALRPAGNQLALTLQLNSPIGSSAAALVAVRGPDGKRVRGISQ